MKTQTIPQVTMNTIVDGALRELEELGLEEIEVIPELSDNLGIGKDNFDWLDEVLKVEN